MDDFFSTKYINVNTFQLSQENSYLLIYTIFLFHDDI